MNRSDWLFATIAAIAVAGCASVETPKAEAQWDKNHVTGSRLPTRDGATSADVKTIENKEAIGDMMQRGSGIYIPPKGGTN